MSRRRPFLCILIVCLLGAVAIIGEAGIILFGFWGREAPPSLVAVVAAALGALSTFAVPDRREGRDSTPKKSSVKT